MVISESLRNPIIETERLIMKPITMHYRDEIFKEFTPEITVHMCPQPTGDIKDTEKFINESIQKNEAGTNLQFVIVKKDTDEFLGNAGLHLDKEQPEFGIWIKKSAHGNGCGFEAIRGIKEWAEQNLDYDYLSYPVVKDNKSSRKIPEKLGGKNVRSFVGKTYSASHWMRWNTGFIKNKKIIRKQPIRLADWLLCYSTCTYPRSSTKKYR